jgi:hypothetical protein
MGKKSNPAQDVINTAKTAYQPTTTPGPQEQAVKGMAGDVAGTYRNAVAQSGQNYNDIMQGYNTFKQGIGSGPLGQAAAGYKNFAETGGFSPQDIQEMRARATSPVRAAYGNTMMQMDRARALGGAGGSPNYIAAASKAQRELPQQMSDAMTGINSNLAGMVQQGKLAGMGGMASTGATMGQEDLAASQGQAGLYGTAPGLSSAYANQMNQLYGLGAGMEGQRQGYGLNLMGNQLQGYSANQGQQGQGVGSTIAGLGGAFLGGFFSDRNMKKNIREVKMPITEGLRKLRIFNWEYKGDNTKHIGPMAQDFKKIFGVGDGKTLHPADIFGVIIGAEKEKAYA